MSARTVMVVCIVALAIASTPPGRSFVVACICLPLNTYDFGCKGAWEQFKEDVRK